MKKITKTLILPFIIGNMSLLTACGGGGGDGSSSETTTSPVSTLSSYFFTGTTVESGSEIWKTDGTEAGTVLVKEVNEYAGSNPSSYIQVGDKVFFLASTNSTGADLWVSDSESTRLVKVINPNGNSSIQSLTVHGSELYFVANNGVNGYELWKSDGTDAGTVMVKDITVGSSSFYPQQLTSVGNVLYFLSNSYYPQLWKTDGTEAGTVQVNTTKSFSYRGISKLTAVGTKLYFIGIDTVNGAELWSSDGTDAGTVVVKDIQTGTASGLNYSYSQLFNVNGKLIFSAYSGLVGEAKTLWTSDGTEVGTTQLLDSSGTVLDMYYYPTYAKMAGNTLYYRNSSSQNWKTDGTAAGSVSSVIAYNSILGTVNDKTLYSSGSNLTVTDNVNDGTILNVSSISSCKTTTDNAICFSNTTGGYRVWQTDGSLAGTIEITSAVDSGKGYFTNTNVLPVSSGFYYSDLDSSNALEPWFSDGTANGTAMLTDIVSTPMWGSNPNSAVAMSGIQYFLADDGNDGEGLWRTDGTEAGTYRVKDINPGSDDRIQYLTVMGDKLFFSARDDENGQELWISDGTEEGTHIFINIASGNDSSSPSYLTVAGSNLYWEAWGYVWVTDGTLSGTNLVSTTEPDNGLTASGENVYFIDDNDYGLWVTSGEFATTHIVKPSNDRYDNGDPRMLIGANGLMYYISEDEESERQLWVTDGSDAGSRALTNYPNGVSIDNYQIFGNILYFTMDDDTYGEEMWKSDGTVAGTVMVKDINIGNNGSYPYNLNVVNGYVYFNADDGVTEDSLWRTDGTDVGIVKVSDILDNRTNFSNFYIHNDNLYFSTSTEGVPELWVTDGTEAGTKMLYQFDTEAVDNNYSFSSFGEKLFFTVRTTNEGKELWVTDGTDIGTHIVKDINFGVKDGASSLQAISDGDCC